MAGGAIVSASGALLIGSTGAARTVECCCCELYNLISCPDLTATDLYIEPAALDPRPGTFFKVGDICYARGDCVTEVPSGGTLVTPGDSFESCEECVQPPSYLCAPNEDEVYTDEELAAMYPDLRLTFWGVRYCPCYEFTPDDGVSDNGVSYKIVIEGINGATFLLIPSILYHVDHGHCRNYTYSIAPAGFQTLTEMHFGHFATDCSATEEGWKTDNNAYDSVAINATLCCVLDVGVDPPVSQWSYSFGSAWTANYGGIDAGTSGTWSGLGGHMASATNTVDFDSDCKQEIGPPDQNPIGGGIATLFATAPGI